MLRNGLSHDEFNIQLRKLLSSKNDPTLESEENRKSASDGRDQTQAKTVPGEAAMLNRQKGLIFVQLWKKTARLKQLLQPPATMFWGTPFKRAKDVIFQDLVNFVSLEISSCNLASSSNLKFNILICSIPETSAIKSA